MKVIDLNKAVCKCGKKGKIFSDNKWWCSLETYEGEFNIKGYCKKDKK